ncbi:MAG: MarR family transcriptional regulator [Candidatus Aenigmatarchaeota archaeon]
MNQKLLGAIFLISGFFLFFNIYYYTSTILALSEELHKNCPLPANVCPYKRTIPFESYFGFYLASIVMFLGGYLIFSKKDLEKLSSMEKTKIEKARKALDGEEKRIFEMIVNSDGAIFQSDLVKRTGLSKVKISRILDRLEAKGLIERKRRGMANLVVLKL